MSSRALERELEHFREMSGRKDIPANECELWARLADEVDTYLHPMSGEADLFGEAL